MDILKGRVVYKLSDDINTDKILAGRYLVLTGDKELAEHCFEGHIQDWNEKVKEGDILVGGDNFGCGSSRESAPQAIKEVGVGCVVAKSFARIFLRSAVNIGLTVLECEDAVDLVSPNDDLEIDFRRKSITDLTTAKTMQYRDFPPFMQEIINAGGLVEYAKKRLAKS